MKYDYCLMEPPPVEAVEACPCCGSSARVWVYSEDPTMPVKRVVMCDNSDSIGPRDSLVYEGCLLQMPSDDFYRETGRDAVRYWNEYAKALTAAQRANRWKTAKVLRGPQQDNAAAAHAQGLRERIAELEAQLADTTADYMRLLREKQSAMLEAQRVPLTEWRPIETAPRDGSTFIGWNGRWRGVARYFEPNYEDDPIWTDERTEYITPPLTHWMPLPPPPDERAHGIEEVKR